MLVKVLVIYVCAMLVKARHIKVTFILRLLFVDIQRVHNLGEVL